MPACNGPDKCRTQHVVQETFVRWHCTKVRPLPSGESRRKRLQKIMVSIYHPPTMDGKHTDAAPALPKSLAIAGSGNASVTGQHAWHLADWGKATRSVRSLQVRIAEAYKNKRYRKMKALQNVLRRSLAAKMLAIRRVTDFFAVANHTAKSTGMPRPLSRAL